MSRMTKYSAISGFPAVTELKSTEEGKVVVRPLPGNARVCLWLHLLMPFQRLILQSFVWMRELPNTFPINSSAYNHGNQFSSLTTKSPDGAGGYYNN